MLLFLCCLVISPSPASAAAAGSKRVLMLYSYGRNFAAFSAVGSSFQTELAEHFRVPIQFHEVSLPGPLFEPSELEQPTLNYVHGLFGGSEPDLIVPVGGPAARYALRFRQQLFPSAPLLLAGVEARHLKTFTLDTNTTTVAMTVDFPGLVEHARRILPGTTNFAVVLGRSRLEVFWKEQLQREFTVFTNQVGFTWLDQYSLTEMQEQVGRLPPHSAIFYVTLLVDAAGVPYEADKAIKALYAAANAPIVGLGDQGLGLGSVGGPMRDPRTMGQETARVATRILNGEPPGEIHVSPMTPVYDWRELRRWNISEDRLPPGSLVKFREPTVWERHRDFIIAGVSLMVVQAALIASLVLNLRRRRNAERSLLESEERMKLAAEAAQLGMWEWDIATNRVWLDEQARERIGANDSQSEYSRFWRAVHPDDRADVAEALAKAINGDGSYENVHRRVLADGEVRWISARGRVEFDAERKPMRMRGVGMDITARKLAEDQARESERQFQRLQQEVAHVSRVAMLGELAGSTAHELNQPLTAIVSSAEAAERFMKDDRSDDEEVRDALKDIAEQGKRAGEIIARIRGMLKKDPGQMTKLDINLAVREVLEMTRSDLLIRGVTPVLRLDPRLPCVNGYGVQLRQVLLNLVMNACDAMSDMPADQRQLTIESKRATADEIEVSVADSGTGFPEEMLRNAFEPFRTTKPKGLGLGLIICRSIIRTHGGRLVAANNSNKGATLRFTLPADHDTLMNCLP